MAANLKVTVFKYSLRRSNDRMTVTVAVKECAIVVVMLLSHAATIVANQVT